MGRKVATGPCKTLGCTRDVRCRGLCPYHYEVERRKKKGVQCAKCAHIVFAVGLCARHYQAHVHGYKKENGKARGLKCAYPDCEREVFAKKYCQKHYMRTWDHGVMVPDGYRRRGGRKTRKCLYCGHITQKGPLCGEHADWPLACVICGYDRYVESAHVIPKAQGGPREDWNLVPLCPNHHRLYDGGMFTKEEHSAMHPYTEVAETMMRETQADAEGSPSDRGEGPNV